MAAAQSVVETGQASRTPREIQLPASTAWPLVLALGFTLICAGLLTGESIKQCVISNCAYRRSVFS